MLANLRRDPFTDADQSIFIEREPHTVPSNSPYYVWLKEVPREDDPVTVAVREESSETDIQPDGTAGLDTYVFQDSSGTNYGTSIILVTGRDGTPPNGRYRSLLKFDLSSVGSPSVEQAKLRLFLEATGGGGYPALNQVAAHRVTSTWSEGTVTYGTAPTFNPVAEDVADLYSTGWYEWDITSLVNDWLSGAQTNHGLLLKHADESATDTARNFTSSDGSASQRPMLRVQESGTEFGLVAKATTPGAGECGVAYDRACLRFNAADAGKSIEVDYWGTGAPVLAEHVSPYAGVMGEGEDGALLVTGSTTLLEGIYSYTSVDILPGATLTLTGASTIIHCTGDVNIQGKIDMDGRGHGGGLGAVAGSNGKNGRGLWGGEGGQGTTSGAATAGGGGGGGSSTIGTAGTNGTGGTGGEGGDRHLIRGTWFWPHFPPPAGGGGGGGGGNSGAAGGDGGQGGGALTIIAEGSVYISSSAVLTAKGNAGGNPDGGGGGGGVFLIRGATLDINTTPVVTGGAGNGLGGAGAAGWYHFEAL